MDFFGEQSGRLSVEGDRGWLSAYGHSFSSGANSAYSSRERGFHLLIEIIPMIQMRVKNYVQIFARTSAIVVPYR